MSQNSSIEWTDDTWSVVSGCTRASAGCDNCYAVRMSYRLERMGQRKYLGLTVLNGRGDRHFNGTIKLHPHELTKPLGWKKPRRVFVCSMSDLFHRDVPFDFIDRVFAVMAITPHHTYQVLTKRPERMAEYLTAPRRFELVMDAASQITRDPLIGLSEAAKKYWPLSNVWLGTSVEDQDAANKRIPHILKCPAAVRFLSVEPMLGAVNLDRWIKPMLGCGSCNETYELGEAVPDKGGHPHGADKCARCGARNFMLSFWGEEQLERFESGERYANGGPRPEDDGCQLDWVIVGGESGPGARPFDLEWARSIVGQCKAAGVACFVKQLGSRPLGQEGVDVITSEEVSNRISVVYKGVRPPTHADDFERRHEIRFHDPKGGNMAEWPEDLRVREMPEVARG